MSDDLVKRLRALVDGLEDGRVCYGHPYIHAAVDAINRIEELDAANCGLVRLNEATEARAKTAENNLTQLCKSLGVVNHVQATFRIAQLTAFGVDELEAKLREIEEEWAGAIYGDLESGVASLNRAAWLKFQKDYPLVSSFGDTIDRIIYGGNDDKE